MPDPDSLPDGLSFSPGLVQQYKTMPNMFVSSWKSFGNGADLEPPPIIQVAKVEGASGANIANYPEWAAQLAEAYDSIATLDTEVAKMAGGSKKLCDEGRNNLADSIDLLHTLAQVNPGDLNSVKDLINSGVLDPSIVKNGGDISEDEYVMAIMTFVSDSVSGIMQQQYDKFDKLGSGVKKKNPEDAGKTPKLTDTGKKDSDGTRTVDTGNNANLGPGNVTDDSPAAPPVWDWDSSTASPTSPADSVLQPVASTADRSPVSSAADPASSPVAGSFDRQTPSSAQPAAATSPAPAVASAMPNYGLPLTMANLAGRQAQANSEGARPQEFSRPSATVRAVGAASSQPAMPLARTAAASAPPAATSSQSPPATSTTPSSGAPTQSNHPPARASAPTAHPVAFSNSEDGSTVFTFPDGRQQRVPVPVANALTAALGNAATTDGRAAYDNTPARIPEDTPGRIPEGKVLGTPADSNDLVTGDLARWDNRTAIVVVFPADSGNTLEVIIEGSLRLIDSDTSEKFGSNMSDKNGDFGDFGGFFHPAGIDISDTGSADGPVISVMQSADGPATVPV